MPSVGLRRIKQATIHIITDSSNRRLRGKLFSSDRNCFHDCFVYTIVYMNVYDDFLGLTLSDKFQKLVYLR